MELSPYCNKFGLVFADDLEAGEAVGQTGPEDGGGLHAVVQAS